MKKKSLLISDSERYGGDSPAVALGDGKEKDRKSAPTITLTGKQVDAFCTCSLEVGQKGKATVDFVVKAVSAGDKYGSDVPTSTKPKEVTLSLTHAVAENQDGEDGEADDEDEEEGEDPEEEKAESPADEKAEEDAEPDEPESEEPKAAKKSVSPKDADL